MYINHDDLVALATGPTVQGEQILKSMDREIVSYKRVVSFDNVFSGVLSFESILAFFFKSVA